MENDKFIKLTSPLRGTDVEKLKVLYFDKGVFALEKPAGLLIDAYPWYPDTGSIVAALKREISQKNHGLSDYHLDSIHAVYTLEPELTGVALLSTEKVTSDFLRNELGSGKFIFKFVLLAKKELEESFVECNLPLAKHHCENTVLVSNKTGKKCKTSFRLITTLGSYQLWEAQTDYVRMHQIRVHAMERGIHIIGEKLYTEAESPRSYAFKSSGGKKLAKKLDRKLVMCDDLCLHLSSVQWEQDGRQITIKSPLPQRMHEMFEKGY